MTTLNPFLPAKKFFMDPVSERQCLNDLKRILVTGCFAHGEFTERLEAELGLAYGRQAVAVGSAMDALELVLEHLGVTGRHITLPANCFEAIPALIVRMGGHPEPVAVDPATLCVDAEALGRATHGILLWVHHCGLVAPGSGAAIRDLRERGWTVVEDSAHVVPNVVHLTRPRDQMGQVEILSFNPTKPIASARGGAFLSDDTALLRFASARRSHGGAEAVWKDGGAVVRERRIGEINAAIALCQWNRRNEVVATYGTLEAGYRERLGHVPWTTLPGGRRSLTPLSRMPIALRKGEDAEDLAIRLRQNAGIACSMLYSEPWFDYPFFVKRSADPDGLDDALRASTRALLRGTLCLPMHERMNVPDLDRVVNALLEICHGPR